MRWTRRSSARSSWARSSRPWRTSLAALAAASAFAGAALAGDEPAPPKAVALPIAGCEAVTSPEEALDDFPALFERWMDVLEKDLDTPHAEIILRRMRWVGHQAPVDLKRRLARIEGLIAKGPKRGEVSILLALARAELLRMKGSWGEAEKVESGLAVVKRWLVIGPFGDRPAVDHYRPYPPESAVDIGAAHEGTRGEVKWRLSPRPGPGTGSTPKAVIGRGGGVAYCLGQVRSDEAREAYVHVNLSGSWKLWLGGELAYDADRSLEWVPEKVVARVRLAKGWNRLLFKSAVAAQGITCRLTDRKGFPLRGLEVEQGLKLHPADEGSAALPYRAAPLECALEHYRSVRPGIERGMDDAAKRREACDHGSLALMLSMMGLHDEALDQAEAATKLWGDSAHLQYLRGRVISAADHLSASDRRNRAREAFETAKKCPGGFIPAHRELAGQYVDDDKHEEALDELKAAVKANTSAYLVWEQMARIAMDRKWRNEAYEWMSKAERLRPRHDPVRVFWADFYGGAGNAERRLEEFRELMRRDRSGWAAMRVAEELAKRGEFDEALKLVRARLAHDPDNVGLRRQATRMLVSAGRLDGAAAELRSLAELIPTDPGLHRTLGEIYARMKKPAEAMSSYEAALKLAPGAHDLRRYVKYLRGEEVDFSKPYPLDLKQELKRVGGPEKYPGATQVLVLDQTVTRIHPDGSQTSIVHNAKKILNDRAVKELSEIFVPGEVLEARVHLPDGTVLEPTVIEEGGALTMPGLKVGAVVEWKYRQDGGAQGWRRFRLGSWFFRPPDFNEPHHLSRYVVLVPKGLDGEVIKMEHNWRRADGTPLGKPPAEEVGGYRVYRWVARDTKRLEPERHMPHRDELLPFVDVGSRDTWDAVAYRMVGREFGRVKLTGALRGASAEALKGLGEKATVREKAHAVYRYVNDLIKSGGGGYTAHQVLSSKSGDRGILMVALLRAAGIEAGYAFTRPTDVFISGSSGTEPANWEMPSEQIFPHSVLYVFDEHGRPVFFDGSNRYLEFGHVPLLYRGAPVLVPSAAGAQFCTMPGGPLDSESSNTKAQLVVAADGSVSGKRSEMRFGLAAAGRKARFEGYDTSLRKRIAQGALDRIFPGVEVAKVELPDLLVIEKPFAVAVELKAPNFVKVRPDGTVCPTGLAKLKLGERFVGEAKRQLPMKLPWAVVGRDEVTISVEGKWRLAEVPKSVALRTDYGSYVLNFSAAGRNRLRVLRAYSIAPQVIEPDKYAGGFINFLRAIDRADATEVRLRSE